MLNKVQLIGRLGKDPEVRHFDENSAVCNFSLATSESYRDKEGNRTEQTEWHNVVIWRIGLVKVAEKYLHKGSLLYVEGKLRTRSWDDQNNMKRYTTEVVVDNFKMLESRREDGMNQQSNYSAPQEQKPAPSQSSAVEEDPTDDLPF